MKYQTRSYTCGPAAAVNALRLYGVAIPEAQVAKLAGTTSDGTDDRGLMKALRKLGCKPSAVKLTSKIAKRVMSGVPVILHLDNELHWVVIIGCLGRDFVVFDSVRNIKNQEENGVRVLTPEAIGGRCFGICVNRPPELDRPEEET